MIRNLYYKLLLIPLIIAFFLILLSSCSSNNESNVAKAASKKSTGATVISKKKRLLVDVSLIVPETKVQVNFNRKTGLSSDYSTGQSQFAEHGMVIFLPNHIEPIAGDSFVSFFAVNRGGSGTEIYFGIFSPEKTVYKMKAYHFLGDRVKIVSLNIDSNNNIHVAYKKHGLEQSMVEPPAILVQKTFDYKNLINKQNKE